MITVKDLPVCPARHTDPETSHEAAKAAKVLRGAQRTAVYGFLQGREERGATDYEIATALGILRSSSSKRRGELVEAGLVSDSGRRRATDTKSTAIVWTANDQPA